MATIKQINANRKNALLSRGPTSKLGKLNSSKNSLKHGLTAKQLVIGENLKEFEKYRDKMIDALKPEGILEEQVAFKIIDVGFRLQRIGGIEAGIYNQEILHHEADEYKNKIAEKIEFKEEGELVQSWDKPTNLKGLAFCRDSKYGSAILKLNTIEDKLMNKYYRLLDILKMMQGTRWVGEVKEITLLIIPVSGEVPILEKRSQIIVILWEKLINR